MSLPFSPAIEALIHAEVERAVAPYAKLLPPWALDKMREITERYWREHPEASVALRAQEDIKRIRSGTEPIAGPDAELEEKGRGKEQA